MGGKIRAATIDDLPLMQSTAEAFYASSKYLRGFDISRFCRTWEALISSGMGVIYILETDGRIVGALGGMKYQDLYNGEQIAIEFFWFIEPRYRGQGLGLYYQFEDWAKAQSCSQIRMAHLCDLMPEQIKFLYGELGFEAIEIHYAKELQP